MVKVWLSSYLWLPHNQRACSFKVVQMVSRSMRDWQHAMAYGLMNYYNIHHFKQAQNHLTLNGVGLRPSVILPLHQMTLLAVG